MAIEKKSQSSLDSESPGLKRFKIPEQYFSLYHSHASIEEQEQLRALEKTSTELKRKASELNKSDFSDFLKHRRQLIKTHMEIYSTLTAGYKTAREANKTTEEEYTASTKICWNERAKLADESLILGRDATWIMAVFVKEDDPDFEGFYTSILTYLRRHEARSAASWELINVYRVEFHYRLDSCFTASATETTWRKDVYDHYNSRVPVNDTQDGELWCPITHQYAHGTIYRRITHLVPHALGYPLVEYIFNEPDNGRDIVWSMKNAIVMDSAVEQHFFQGDFVLLPLKSPQHGKPQEWQVYVLNKRILKQKLLVGNLTWQDLHQRTLVWKNNRRPGAQYLYYHFITNMLRFKRYEIPQGGKRCHIELPTDSIWNKPPPYICYSTLKLLAEAILGDGYEIPSGLYWDGAFESSHNEEEEVSVTEKEEMKMKILVALEKPDTLADLEEEDIRFIQDT